MASDFQIQEMIYQDADGVLFQAFERQTGHLVALRRFFLEEEVLEELREREGDNQSRFEQGLEWMKALEIPHLQKILGGGFDELDGTPFFVTEWIEGKSLDEAHEQNVFSPGDGQIFEAQVRSVLQALPEEARSAIQLREEEILIARDDSGGLHTMLLLSPLRYFGAMGGMTVPRVDQEEALRLLVERFPAAASVAEPAMRSPEIQTAPITPLKSAQAGSDGGLLWGSLAALFVLLGVGCWFLFSFSKEKKLSVEGEAPQTREEPQSEELVREQATGEPAASALAASADEDVQDSIELAEIPSDGESEAPVELAQVEETVPEPETEAESPGAAAPRNRPIVMEEKALEGEIDLFGDDEEVADPDRPYFTPKDLAQLKQLDGQAISFRGKVVESNQSGGKGTLWYLDFGDRRDQPFVVFRHTESETPVQRADWDEFVGKEVFVSATVQVDSGKMARGSGVWLRVSSIDDIRFQPEEPEEKVYQFADLEELKGVSEGEEVIFEGAFADFRKNGDFVYLLFQDGYAIVGRFPVGGALSNRPFAEKLNQSKGSRVRLTGIRASDTNPNFAVVIGLEAESGFSVIE
ncbi:hypothetical protein [Roseibacillus persicicus]|uniref:Protein kinase domain-containing protein n=1 Tax=Roseibacillus persicicus TaxID=454148 RepID=A0A918THW3_9BACT|nr:hypothetical protein [Roseibacillus persicicus]GHC48397.1 hypothetical protein GCM10007100_12840 [Roseibacillus persicicus]